MSRSRWWSRGTSRTISRDGSVQVGVDRTCGVPGQLAGLAAQHVAPRSAGSIRNTSGASRGHDVPAALVDLAVQLLGAPAGVPGEDPQPLQAAVEQLDRACRGRPGRAGRRPRGSPPARRRGSRSSATAERALGADRAAVEEHLGLGDDVAPAASTSATGTGEGRLSTTPSAPSSSTSSSSTTVSAKFGSSSAGVATSSIPARASVMAPSWPTARHARQPRDRAARRATARAATGRGPDRGRRQAARRPPRGPAGSASGRGGSAPGAALDLGADPGGGGVLAAGAAGHHGEQHVLLGGGLRHGVGHRARRGARRGERSRIARTPGSSSAVALPGGDDGASRSMGWSSARARSGRPGGCASAAGGRRAGSARRRRSRRRRRRPSAGRRRGGRRRWRSRCGGSLRGGGRTSRSWSVSCLGVHSHTVGTYSRYATIPTVCKPPRRDRDHAIPAVRS